MSGELVTARTIFRNEDGYLFRHLRYTYGYDNESRVISKEASKCKLPVKCVLQNKRISPDSVRFVQIRLRIGTNSIKLYQFGTDLL